LRGWADGPKAKKTVRDIRARLREMVLKQDFAPEPMQVITSEVLTSLAGQFLGGKLTPKNAPYTLARKEPETRPLMETGELVGSLRARLMAAAVGWAFEADSPYVTGPALKQPKFGPKISRKLRAQRGSSP
jgi:hypothetical protein